MKYVDFGYLNDALITHDGELLATLGFELSDFQKAASDSTYDHKMWTAFLAAKGNDNHSGYSWSCVRSVAAVLVKHGWKSVEDIPEDHPLAERIVVA